jgi:hypothetical protein
MTLLEVSIDVLPIKAKLEAGMLGFLNLRSHWIFMFWPDFLPFSRLPLSFQLSVQSHLTELFYVHYTTFPSSRMLLQPPGVLQPVCASLSVYLSAKPNKHPSLPRVSLSTVLFCLLTYQY